MESTTWHTHELVTNELVIEITDEPDAEWVYRQCWELYLQSGKRYSFYAHTIK